MVKKLNVSLYFDDVVTGAKDTEEAYQLYLESKGVLKEGGFNLRTFVTNDDLLQQKIEENEEHTCEHKLSVSPSDETCTKATLATATLWRTKDSWCLLERKRTSAAFWICQHSPKCSSSGTHQKKRSNCCGATNHLHQL